MRLVHSQVVCILPIGRKYTHHFDGASQYNGEGLDAILLKKFIVLCHAFDVVIIFLDICPSIECHFSFVKVLGELPVLVFFKDFNGFRTQKGWSWG